MNQQCRVSAIVQNHIGAYRVGPLQNAVRVLPVLVERLALVREYRRSCSRDRRGRMVLGRIDIARRPAHVRAQRLQRLDQHRCLNGHVQASRDARAAQGLLRREFVADSHETRHLGLRYGDLLAAPWSELQVRDSKIGEVLDVCWRIHTSLLVERSPRERASDPLPARQTAVQRAPLQRKDPSLAGRRECHRTPVATLLGQK